MKAKDIWLGECQVGDYYVSDTYEVTEEEIIAFAKQYDPQTFHIDPIKAKDSFFKGLAASGWLTGSVMMKLQVASNPFGFGLVGVEVSLEWPSPTRTGDILQIRTEIKDIKMSRSKPNRGILSMETITTNQHGEVRMVMQNKILGFTRPE